MSYAPPPYPPVTMYATTSCEGPMNYDYRGQYSEKVKCLYCGNWGKEKTECIYCGGAIPEHGENVNPPIAILRIPGVWEQEETAHDGLFTMFGNVLIRIWERFVEILV